MAYQSIWYYTDIDQEVVKRIEYDINRGFEDKMVDSCMYDGSIIKSERNSQNAWIPSHHWVGGFLWNYIQRANRENFLYDIDHFDSDLIQYTRYEEGQFYKWHIDAGIGTYYKPDPNDPNDHVNKSSEMIRKISFAMQLSDPDEYEGGDVQLMDEGGKTYFVPRQRGTVVLFDSRTPHRVRKVKKGVRKSLVGWVCGPRWR